MTKGKKTIGQAMIYKTLHINQKSEPVKISGVNGILSQSEQN
jgi:hypothetical protein